MRIPYRTCKIDKKLFVTVHISKEFKAGIPYHLCFPFDLFQPKMSTFYTHAIIFWYHKTVTQMSWPNSFLFRNKTSQYIIHSLSYVMGCFYLFEIYSSVVKGVSVLVIRVFVIFQKLLFHFYISKELTIFREVYL